MTPPLSPERLTRLLHDAVQPVTAHPGALDRIRRGARRRRATRRTGAVLLAAAVIAGGAFLVFTPGGGPARIGSLSSSSAGKVIASSGRTRTAALPSPGQPSTPSAAHGGVPSPGPSAPTSPAQSAPTSPAQSAPTSPAQGAPPSLGLSAPPTRGPSAPPSVAPSAPPSVSPSPLAPPSPSVTPSASRPAAPEVPFAGWSGTWAIDGLAQPAARVTIVPVGGAQTTFSFLLVVRTASYGTQTVPFTATSVRDMPPDGPVIVGTADAAKDGHTELFVMVDTGCCTQFWTIFRLVGGHIAQVSLSGAPMRLSVGGSVMLNFGFSCNGPYLVTYSYAGRAGSPAPLTFLGTRDIYRWAGASLVLVSQRHEKIRGLTNPELAAYSGVSCGGLPQYEYNR